MTQPTVMVLGVLVYSAFPLLVSFFKDPLRIGLYYVYAGAVLTIGGFIGAVFSIQLGAGVTISAGNLAYAALMMTMVMLLIQEHDPVVMRRFVIIVIVVNLFKIPLFWLFGTALASEAIVNPYATAPSVFSISIWYTILGGILIIAETLLVMWLFAFTEKRVKHSAVLSLMAIVCFVLIIVLDGIAFPAIASGFTLDLVSTIAGGLQTKLILAGSFGAPLLVFLVIHHQRFGVHGDSPLRVREVFLAPQFTLEREIESQHRELTANHAEILFQANLIRAVGDGIIAVDSAGTVEYWNEGASKLLGVPAAEALGKSVEEVLRPDMVGVVDGFAEARSGKSWAGDFSVRSGDGGSRTMSLRVIPIASSGRGNAGAVGIFHDASDLLDALNRLRESEADLQKAQRVGKLGSWTWDIARNTVRWSDEMYRIFGIDPGDLTGDLAEVIQKSIHPDDVAAVNYSNRMVMEHGHAEPLEYRIVRSDGTVRTVWAEAGELVRNDDGSPAVLSGIVHDITDRALAERRREETEERFLMFMDYLPGYAFVKDSTKSYLFVNEYFRGHLLGNKSSPIGLTNQDLFPAALAEQLDQSDDTVLNTGDSVVVEYEILEEGIPRWYLTHKFPIDDRDGNRLIGGIAIDMSDLRQAEREIADSERRYRVLVETANDLIWSIDRDGILTFVNSAAERILGYHPDEMIGQPWSGFVRYSIAAPGYPGNAFSDEVALKGEIAEVQNKDGQTVFLRTNALRLFENGEHVGATGTSQDITGVVHAERQARRSREQLRALTNHLQTAIESERKRIARELHDEFGQLLTAIRLDLEWMRKLEQPVSDRATQIGALIQLVSGALQTTRRIASELRPGLLDELGLLAALEWQVREFADRSHVECTLTVSPDFPALDAGLETTVFRIVQESLTNVAKHADATRVDVVLTLDEESIHLSVVDDGRGIQPTKSGTPTSFGVLGMKERASHWNGTVSLDSQPGSGTSVNVTLSRTPGEVRDALEA